MSSAHALSFQTLAKGEPLPLESLAGKAVLVVNVASACGLTPQYAGLEALYQAHKDQGLVVLGIPCNDFGAQESGSETEIATFCDTRYRVTFPMTGKVAILDAAERHPFYGWLAQEAGENALPRWNFHKVLLAKDGTLTGVFGSRVEPQAAELTDAIKAALA
ncbi:MAG: glutathione peroxidase [Alphaproteobacteria bacterium]|nr:glutathione peroxidase [Alphaproteobacteria bacterium]